MALGSNIDPQGHIKEAVGCLSREFPGLIASSFKLTKPLGIIEQPDFLNGVVFFSTDLDQTALKLRLKQLESLLGRQPRVEKWGPREIDLDLIIMNGKVVDPDYYDRDFLQQAVTEILPDLSGRCY